MSIRSGSSNLSDYEDITDISDKETENISTLTEDNKPFVCNSVEEATRFLRNYEIHNTVRFAALSTPKNFGNTDMDANTHKVLWEISEDLSATPYILLSTKRFNCHHGFDRNSAAKRKHFETKEIQKMDHWYKADYVIIQDSKKFNCPAKAIIKEVVYFRDSKLINPSDYGKKKQSKEIKESLQQKKAVITDRKFIVEIDCLNIHMNHPLGKSELLSQKIDPQLAVKISEYIKEGVSNVREMKRLLKITVNEMFGKKNLPAANNRRFYPRTDIIRSHMVKERQKGRHSIIDQECLESKINEWKNADASVNIYFQSKERDFSDELLFVYQAFWQKKLLKKYGNEMVFLDATYKTTRYSLPLFFLVVKTNVDYQIVATFVSESETFEAITEALGIIKSWNEDFQPLYCMTDYCTAEIRALETIFVGCEVFICDFHREQSWDRWLKKSSSGCSDRKDDILYLLRSIAWSKSSQEEENAIRLLEMSDFWCQESFTKLKQYIGNYWLPIKKRWVWWYRQNRLLVNCNTNNGLERQNESFKYSYLQRYKNSSLTGMLTLLIDEFFSDKLDSYTDANFKMDARYRRYGRWVPNYLYNRPHSLVKDCLIKKDIADNMNLSGVIMIKHGVFAVSSCTKTAIKYFASFGDDFTMPKCTCQDWMSTAYPCKHFFLVFRKYPAWSWSALSSLYLNSPYLNLDADDYEVSHEKTPYIQPEGTSHHKTDETVTEDWSQKSKNITSVYSGVNVREMLTTIQNLSFEFKENSEEIVLMHNTLASLIDKLNRARTRESGIPLPPVPVKVAGPSNKHIPIPIRKSRKLFSDRVGSHKDKVTAASKILLMEKSDTTESVEVNIVEPVDGKDMFIEELIVASDVNDELPIERYHLSPNCNLTSDDLLDISAKHMLSDTVIHTMQKMITGVCGLQDPVLGQNLLFDIQKASFVQVLHDGDAHWLTISTFGCSVGEVFLLDSMFRGKLKNHVIRQICAIMHCTEDILTVHVVPVQQQTNIVDCGLYALAFVKHIADTGSNPSYVAFDESQMRNHLLQCVKGNQFNAFPKSETALRFCKEKDFQFSLYCICRQVWLASDKCIKERHMVQCGKCENWYHRACERIPEYVLEDESTEWSCFKCCSIT